MIVDIDSEDSISNNIQKSKYNLDKNDNQIFEEITKMSNKVYKSIGTGLSEAIYHNGLECELRDNSIKYDTEFPIPIYHDKRNVGFCRGDILIEIETKKYILELKAIRSLKIEHVCQLQAYLRHMKIEIGFLINFPYPEGNNISVLIIHKDLGNIS